MDRASLRPLAVTHRADSRRKPSAGDRDAGQPASPKKRKLRPGWRPVIVREGSLQQLRALQKSTRDPSVDLSYLCDACVQLALDLGGDAIVRRALADLQAKVTS